MQRFEKYQGRKHIEEYIYATACKFYNKLPNLLHCIVFKELLYELPHQISLMLIVFS